MRAVKVDRYRVSAHGLAAAADVLRRGGVVVMPTETAYGLAASPDDAKAVRGIFRIKGRPARKPLPLIAASLADVRARFILEGGALALARKHWPGPLTLVLPLKPGLHLAATAGERTGAVRVPRSAWARRIALAAGGLITSTSANVSGQATLYDPRTVIASFRGRRHVPDLVLDAGRLPARAPSTIVRVKRGKIEILREGPVEVRK